MFMAGRVQQYQDKDLILCKLRIQFEIKAVVSM